MKFVFCAMLVLASQLLPAQSPPADFGNVQVRTAEADSALYIVILDDAPLADYAGDARSAVDGDTMAKTAVDQDSQSQELQDKKKLDVDSARSRDYLEHLDARHADVIASISGLAKRTVLPRFRYRVVTNGLAVELTAEQARSLRELPGVKSVERDGRRYMQTDAGPAWIGASFAWTSGQPGARGEGVVVGVIDSGINAAHPSFADVGGDGFNHANPRGRQYGRCQSTPGRCNDKLIGIYDFTTEGQSDGTDTTGHGTHVASTAIGNAVDRSIEGQTIALPLRVSGVAPHAAVISYKACTREDDCPFSALLAALDQATTDGVDIINYSIQGFPRDIREAVASGNDDIAAFLRARNTGVVAAVAAGNMGPGAASVSSPGNAPWVIGVANASHDRRFANRLVDVTGAGVSGSLTFEGDGITGALTTRAIVDAADFGSAGCGNGEDLELPPSGISNPWPSGTFNGQIVVCRRGVQARVAKGFNVRAAGGAGMILVNTAAEGESIVSDDHYLPAVHLGFAEGTRLLAAMAQATGSGLSGSISGTQALRDSRRADVLAPSSGRGPIAGDSYLKPNLTAPGTNILAAAQTGAGLASLSGTSMATPHVAGAAALVLGVHPNWNVSQVESALNTTTTSGVRKQDGVTIATNEDAGAGRLQVGQAIFAALHFPESGSVMSAAFASGSASVPNSGGDVVSGPAALNLPSIAFGACARRCTFFRTVRDNGSGSSWAVTPRDFGAASVTVSPAQFSLAPNQQQQLRIEVRFDAAASVGTRTRGHLEFFPQSPGPAVLRVPVSVRSVIGNLPARIDLAATADGGFQDLTLEGLAALSNPGFDTTDLVRVRSESRALPSDPTGDDAYDLPSVGAFFVTAPVRVPSRAAGAIVESVLFADARATAGRDVNLFVGLDLDGDNAPDPNEELCRRESTAGFEQCLTDIRVPAGLANARAWFLVQNKSTATDTVTLRAASVTFPSMPGAHELDDNANVPREGYLAASAPGQVAADAPFSLRLSWSSSAMLQGEDWFSAMRVRTAPTGGFSPVLPVFLRVSSAARLARVIQPGVAPLLVRLQGQGSHQGMAVDVPLGVEQLEVRIRSTAAGKLRFVSAGPTAGPALVDTAGAPVIREVDLVPGQSVTQVLSGPDLTSGRWYLVPVNATNTINDVEIAVLPFPQVTQAQRIPPGAFFNPARSGHGLFLSQGGATAVVLWYAYREDGTPEFYTMGSAWPVDGAGSFEGPLLRFTWDGNETRYVNVGRGGLTRTTEGYRFSWTLYGQHGSEPMVELRDGGSCPSAGGVTGEIAGAWFNPAKSGYGYSLFTTTQNDTEVAFLYDSFGNPRWLYAQSAFGGPGTTMPLSQADGACPLCAYRPVNFRVAGQLTRTFETLGTGRMAVDATLLPPLSGTWRVDDAVERLAVGRSCN